MNIFSENQEVATWFDTIADVVANTVQIAGIFVLFIGIAALSLFILFRFSDSLTDFSIEDVPWSKKIMEVAFIHSQATGMFAGFTIAILALAVFHFEKEAAKISVQAIIGLLLLSFFGFISASVLYSTVVKRFNVDIDQQQIFIHSIAALTYHFSAVILFTAFHLIIQAQEFTSLYWFTFIMILTLIVVGYLAVLVPHRDLFKFKNIVCWAMFIVAVLLAFSLVSFINELLKYGISGTTIFSAAMWVSMLILASFFAIGTYINLLRSPRSTRIYEMLLIIFTTINLTMMFSIAAGFVFWKDLLQLT